MSRPRVTITLGRSGQVVQRPASVPDERHSDQIPMTGRKRPVRERLGSNVDNTSSYDHQSNLKRQRRDQRSWKYPHDNNKDGNALQFSNGKVDVQDLRMKLLRKKSSRGFQTGNSRQNGLRDLRERLSGRTRSQSTTTTISRRLSLGNRSEHLLSSRMRNASQRTSPPRNVDASRRMSVPRSMNASRNTSSPRTMDASRYTSTARPVDASRYASTARPLDASRYTSTARSIDASEHASLSVKVNSSTRPIETKQSVLRPQAPGSTTNKNAYPGEELTVTSLLQSLGLSKYVIIFQAEEVDMTILRHMRDDDLKELGIPMGPRKKILLALLSNSRRG